MELKVITDKDFERGYSIRGKLNGTFAEAEEFLGWVLDRNSKYMDNTKHFKEAVKVFTDKWNMDITTKYLRMITEDTNEKIKRSRIGHIIQRAGYTLTPTKRYYRTLKGVQSNRTKLVFGKDDNGKQTITEQENFTIGRLANVYIGETLHRIMLPEEYQRRAERIAFLNLRENLLNEVKKQKEFYARTEGDPRRREKAISRLEQKKKGFISVRCKECKHEIKMPLCPNIETSKIEQLMSGIYGVLLKDIEEGSHLCQRCERLKVEGKGWKKEKAINFFKDLYKQAKDGKSYFGFDYEDFYKEYSFDKKETTCGKVRDKIREFVYEAELETEMSVISNKEDIRIQILKKI